MAISGDLTAPYSGKSQFGQSYAVETSFSLNFALRLADIPPFD